MSIRDMGPLGSQAPSIRGMGPASKEMIAASRPTLEVSQRAVSAQNASLRDAKPTTADSGRKMRSADDITFWQRVGAIGKGTAKSYGSGFTAAAGTTADLVSEAQRMASDAQQEEERAIYQRSVDDWSAKLASAKTDEERAKFQERLDSAQKRLASFDTNYDRGGLEDQAAAAAKKLNETADKLSQSAAIDIDRAKTDLGFGGQALIDLGVAGGQLAGDIGLGVLTGGGALIPMAARSFGGGAQQARQEGASLGQQVAYGAGSAALSVGLEKLSNFAKPLSKAFGAGFADEVIAKLGGKLAATAAGRTVLSALGEGFEEGLETLFDPLLQRLTYDKDAKITADTLAEAGYNALIGGALGGLLGAGGEIASAKSGGDAPSAASGVESAANTAEASTETPAAERAGEAIVEGERATTAYAMADALVESVAPSAKQVNAIAKEPAALERLGINPNGKTASQIRAEVREALTANAKQVTEAPAAQTPVQTTKESTQPSVKSAVDNVNANVDAGNTVGAAEHGFDPFTALQNKYGTLPEGENPVRPGDVPVSTNGTDRVSQSVVTVKEAKVTPDAFVPLIENETVKGGFSFIPITNSATVQSVEDVIMRDGWDESLRNWTSDVRNGKAGEKVTAMGALLYNNAVNAGNKQLALDILSDYMIAVRSSARGLQAARILKTLTPESRLYMMRRSVQRMVEDLRLEQEIVVPAELEEAYLRAEDDAARDEALTEIQQYVADHIPATFMDKIRSLRYLNMLGNFKTQVRNVAGNIGMSVVTELKNLVAMELETMVNAAGGQVERSHSVLPGKALMDVGRADYAELSNVLGYGKYNDGTMREDAFAQGVEDRRTIFKSKLLEGYRKGTNWAMNNSGFGDEAFGRHAYARALSGYLKANGITAEQFADPAWREANGKAVSKAREHAVKEAREATFRDNNVLSDWVSHALRHADTPKALRAIGEGVLPFRRTPANILVRATEYSPLGVVKTSIDAVRKAKGADITGADIIDDIAKTVTGTAIFGLGMLLRNADLLRGGEDDDEEQAAFDDLTGHQAYSLALPDGASVTLDWLTPASMPLFMGVELMDLINEGGFELKDLEQALTSIANPMLEMSMLQGVSDTLADLQHSRSNNLMQTALTAALGYLTQILTNSLIGQVERIAESDSTMTYVDKESPLPAWMQRKIGAASRKIPGLDYNQIPYIDAWGRTEERGDALTRSFNNLINPAYTSTVEVSEMEQELQRLYDATGEGTVLPSRADKSFKVDKKDYNLSADEYVKYATVKGQTSYQYITDAVKSSAYRRMSDKERADLIGKLYQYANYKAKRAAVKSYANNDFAKVEAAEKAGISPVAFYTVKSSDANGNGYLDKTEARTGITNAGIGSAKGDALMEILFPKK